MLTSHGLQSWCARKAGVTRTTINAIFNGKRKATPKHAEQLEAIFIQKRIPLDRWDLLYGVKTGQTLEDYLKNKIKKQGEVNP